MLTNNILWTYNQGAFTINVPALIIVMLVMGLIYLLWGANKSGKLDWTDMIVSRGRKVSLTKLLQLIGGITGTWIMISMTVSGKLTSELLMIYLTYVGAIEGWSKFVAARYGTPSPIEENQNITNINSEE